MAAACCRGANAAASPVATRPHPDTPPGGPSTSVTVGVRAAAKAASWPAVPTATTAPP